jgi:hypothetical protein
MGKDERIIANFSERRWEFSLGSSNLHRQGIDALLSAGKRRHVYVKDYKNLDGTGSKTNVERYNHSVTHYFLP